MNNFWLDLGVMFIAVAYGVGMWWVGIQMGIDIMKNNPDRQEREIEDVPLTCDPDDYPIV